MKRTRNLSVLEIVQKYLREGKYDGLFSSDDNGCACANDDLFPCGEQSGILECRVGKKAPCDCGDHDFHIVEK